jgi:FixJ family two-component response regulator
MDGVEATREIRRRQSTTPVVAITGWEYEERALEVREAGAVDFVRKGRLDRTSWRSSSLRPSAVSVAGAAAQRAADTSLHRGYTRAPSLANENQSGVQADELRGNRSSSARQL